MAITFFGESANPADNGTSAATQITLTPPSLMQAGDLVYVHLVQRGNATMSVGVSGGQRWFDGVRQINGAALVSQTFWCVFNGTWSSDPRFDFSTGTNTKANMLVFRPSAGKTMVLDVAEVTSTFTSGASPFTITITGVTRDAAKSSVAIAAWASFDDNSWGNLTGSGWSKTGLSDQYRNTSGSDSSSTYAYSIGTGATGNVSQNQTANGGDAGTRSIIAFREESVTAVSLDSPADEAEVTDTTPTLQFTGTNSDSGDIVYQVQVDNIEFPSLVDLEDDFGDNSIGLQWDVFENLGASVDETGGRLEITPATSTEDSEGVLFSRFDHSLISKAVFVEVVQIATLANGWTGMNIFLDGSNEIGIEINNETNLIAYQIVGGSFTSLASVTYNGTTMKWLGIWESGGTTFWGYSADGRSWTVLHSASNPIDLTAISPGLMVFENASDASPGKAIFDNFNVQSALIDAFSDADSGFVNEDNGGDTSPFTSGDQISYTVQAGNELSEDTYYWRVRGKDPSGSNTWGAWSETREFTVNEDVEPAAADESRLSLMGVS